MDVLIVRDRRESPKKCSLAPLRGSPELRFVNYAPGKRIEAGRRVLLHTDGELLSARDRGESLLVIDCAWRRVAQCRAVISGEIVRRRLPDLVTAYPRTSRTHQDPERGLASVEALFAALALMGEWRPELLRHYRWREEFLRANPQLCGPIELSPTGSAATTSTS